MAQRPANVALYATSNRRQLVRRYFSDRDDEMNESETVQEKISLADRFGIRIAFSSLTRQEYLDMVCRLAAREQLGLEDGELRQRALFWEMEHAGRTPRIAVQFIAYLKGQNE
jgi:predicted AAA+ superfamily ATPase